MSDDVFRDYEVKEYLAGMIGLAIAAGIWSIPRDIIIILKS